MQNRIELHRQWDVILNLNASGDNYYKVDGYNTTGNPPFTGDLC
jgi:hypothetical protein